jgi:hypothetical protein
MPIAGETGRAFRCGIQHHAESGRFLAVALSFRGPIILSDGGAVRARLMRDSSSNRAFPELSS